jgi:hypothetical protein
VTLIILPGEGESVRDVLDTVAALADGRPYKLGMGGVVVGDDLARTYLERNDPDPPTSPPADDEGSAPAPAPARKTTTARPAKRAAAAKKTTGRAPARGTGG